MIAMLLGATTREGLDTITTLNRAKFAYINSIYEYNIALREFHRARGGDPRTRPSASPPKGLGIDAEGLEPGATCLVRLRFAPTAAGDATAELRVLSRDGAVLGAATLTGVGVPPEGEGP